MKQNRWIFFGIFAFFHLSAFIFTFILDNNTSLLLKMVGWVPSFKWITLLGVILLIIDILWALRINRENEKEKAALQHEINTLKAKMFDLQEAMKIPPPQPPTSNPKV
jgi:hypothetical protein